MGKFKDDLLQGWAKVRTNNNIASYYYDKGVLKKVRNFPCGKNCIYLGELIKKQNEVII